MLEQDATADEIAAYSVTVQVVPPLPVNDELGVGTETGVVITAVEDVAAFATLTTWAVLVLKAVCVGVAVAEVTETEAWSHELVQ